MFLAVLLCCCAFEEIVTSFSLFCWALRKKYLPSALLGILRLSQTFPIDTPAPHFLSPFGTKFLRSYAFSWSCKARPAVESLLFIFPRVVLNAQVCALSSKYTELGQLSVYTHKLSAQTVIVLGGMHGMLAIGKSVCGGELCGVLWVLVGQLVGSAGEASPVAHGWTLWWKLRSG